MTIRQTSIPGQASLPPLRGGSTRMRAANWVRRTTGVLNLVVVIVSVGALAAIPSVIFYDVVARAVFDSPTIWALEVSIILFKALVFLPFGVLLYTDSHLRVTILLDLLTYAFGMALALFMIWHGAKFTMHSWMQGQSSPTLLALPLWISYVLIPLGGVNLLLVALAKIALVFLERTGARVDAAGALPDRGVD